MNFKDRLLDVKDDSIDDVLARLHLRRAPRGVSRFALPALALAGAAAAGWLARAVRAPAGGIQERPTRERASTHASSKAKRLNKAASKVRGQGA